MAALATTQWWAAYINFGTIISTVISFAGTLKKTSGMLSQTSSQHRAAAIFDQIHLDLKLLGGVECKKSIFQPGIYLLC